MGHRRFAETIDSLLRGRRYRSGLATTRSAHCRRLLLIVARGFTLGSARTFADRCHKSNVRGKCMCRRSARPSEQTNQQHSDASDQRLMDSLCTHNIFEGKEFCQKRKHLQEGLAGLRQGRLSADLP